MAFTVLTLSQLAHVLAIRSERDSLFRQGITSNLPLLGAVVFTFALQMAVIYVPFMNAALSTHPLTPAELASAWPCRRSSSSPSRPKNGSCRRGWLYADEGIGARRSPGAAGVE